MKEKIERFSKGIFDYEQPEIAVSQDNLAFFISEGSVDSGSFTVTNTKGVPMKGLIYSSSRLVKIKNASFSGVTNEIFYTVDATYLEQGVQLEGQINIVSDCGEHHISFTISVRGTTCMSSIGSIGNIFQFANLAQTNWNEAVKMFGSDEFFDAVIKKNPEYESAYKVLSASADTSIGLEEFLVLTRKKSECRFFVGTSELSGETLQESFMERITVSKSTWGYLRLSVTADVPFIRPQKMYIENEDFINGKFELPVLIDLENAGAGVHFGTLIIQNAKARVEIPVSFHVRNTEETSMERRRNIRRLSAKIIEHYLKFRTCHIGNGDYLAESTRLTDNLLQQIDRERTRNAEKNTESSRRWDAEAVKMRNVFEIYRAYLATADSNELRSEAAVSAALLRKNEYERRENSLYGALLYIEALRARNREVTVSNLDEIRQLYDREPKSDLLFWLMLYMDRRLQENSELRYARVINHLNRGSTNPCILFEAAQVLRENPGLLKKAEGVECRIMSFCIQRDYLTEAMAVEFADCCRGTSVYDRLRLLLLYRLYDRFRNREILSALVSKVAEMDIRQEKYFPAFSDAVDRQMNLDGIFEYYMYSYGNDFHKPIAQSVLLYFGFNNALDTDYLELIYANMVINQEVYPSVYRAYLKSIEQHAVNCIKARKINDALAVVYDAVVTRGFLDNTLSEAFPDVVFTHRVTSDAPNMKKVIVANDEEEGEQGYPLLSGSADVYLYTDSCCCFFEDGDGNRYLAENIGSVQRYLEMTEILPKCYERGSENGRLFLYMWEKNRRYNQNAENYIVLQKQISCLTTLKPELANRCNCNLVEYYFEKYDPDLLQTYLSDIDLKLLDNKTRARIIEMMIVRDMYDEVIEAVRLFGCEALSARHLSKLCMLAINGDPGMNYRDEEVAMAHFAFRNGRVEDKVLQFLCDNFSGTTIEMHDIWEAAKRANLDTLQLEENLLAQMLFTESFIESGYSVFTSYYFKNKNRKLLRAYISYTAYKYFVKDRVTNPEFFDILRADPSLENSKISILALLKFYSTRERLTQEEKDFSDAHIRHFLQKKVVFAFFKDFKDKIPLPTVMIDKCFVEYRTDPGRSVSIHYSTGDRSELTVEQMNDSGYGIFVKEIILFHGETLQYFITEYDGENEEITESHSLQYLDEDRHETENKYDKINNIMVALEMKDYKTTVQLMEQYYLTEYAMKRHFSPL